MSLSEPDSCCDLLVPDTSDLAEKDEADCTLERAPRGSTMKSFRAAAPSVDSERMKKTGH
jgi:hypothetical protein